MSIDVVSRYIWRGETLGDAALQPYAELSYKGFSLSGWGSVGFLNNKDAREFDITLAYEKSGFNIGIIDYWYAYHGEKNRYFEYRTIRQYDEEGELEGYLTAHEIEANIGYDFGPVAVQWYTLFAGNDGFTPSGKRAYSSYLEVSAPFDFATCNWKLSAGAVPWKTDYYSKVNGFTVVSLGLRIDKEIPISKKWNIPVFADAVYNPAQKKGLFSIGFTLGLPE